MDLVPTGEHSASDGHSPGAQFFVNVQILANKDKEQAIILFGMLFTLIIWIFSALSLALAVLFYIFYLWHHIRDGSLTRYCRRKIDSRLHRIVMVKVNNALAKEYKPRTKQGAKGSRIGPPLGNVKRQPTLPILDTEGNPEFATISRQTTQTSFSPFKSRPSLQNGDTAPNIVARVHSGPNVLSYHQRPEPPSRSTTQSSMRSDASYADDAPLMSSAGSIGYGRPGRGPPARMDSERTLNARPPPPSRVFTSNSQDAQRSYNTSTFRTGPPLLPNSDMSGRMTPHILAPVRQPIPSERSSKAAGQPSGPAEFAPLDQEYEMRSPMHTDRISEQQNNFGYVAFNPNGGGASANSKLSSGLPSARNFTLPDRPANDYFGFIRRPAQRSGTAPLPRGTIFDLALYDSEGKRRQQHDARPMMVPHDRPATAGALWPT